MGKNYAEVTLWETENTYKGDTTTQFKGTVNIKGKNYLITVGTEDYQFGGEMRENTKRTGTIRYAKVIPIAAKKDRSPRNSI